MKWSEQHTRELIRLHQLDQYFFSEIAEQMSVKVNLVRHYARRMALKQGPRVKARFAEWNSKHKHLREPVMKFFVTHTWNQTRDFFGLTDSELKSIFTVGYRDKKLAHLRKDRRRHDNWTERELLFLVRHSGLMPRDWIAKKLNRGTMQSTKECLYRLNTSSKHMNGLPERLANLIVPIPVGVSIKTKAGAPGPNGECHIRLVPWTALEDAIKGKQVKSDIRLAIKALARFQRWVHKAPTNSSVMRKLKRIADEK